MLVNSNIWRALSFGGHKWGPFDKEVKSPSRDGASQVVEFESDTAQMAVNFCRKNQKVPIN